VQIPLFVKDFEKDRIGRQLTILFLTIFILVKANPYYYRCQYFSTASETDSQLSFSIKAKPDHYNFLIRVQKSIVEENKASILPTVKFSGIPLILFALGGVFILLRCPIYSAITASIDSQRLCIAYGILRL